jgi:hypothetical protein
MTIEINMDDAIKKKDKNFPLEDIIMINENIVTVRLREGKGYSYSFFNNVKVDGKYFDGDKFILVVNQYE